jgi:non-ribosomal peptide synthetase component F
MQGKASKYVVLFMGRGKMLPPSYLGIWKAGCTVVPVDIHWPEVRAKGVAEDCGAQLVVTDAVTAPSWNCIGSTLPVLVVDEQVLLAGNGEVSCDSLDQDDDAVVLFTSGSTGKPKGIVLSHGYVTALAVGVSETKEMSPKTRTLSSHSPTWMPFIDYLFGPLLQGGCCVLYPEVEGHIVKPDELKAYGEKQKATLIGLVPAVLDMFLEDGLPPTLTTVGVGGAAVPAELCRRVCEAQEKHRNAFLLTTGYSGTEQGDVTNIRMRSLEDVDEAACGKAIMGAGRPHAGQNFVIVCLHGPAWSGEHWRSDGHRARACNWLPEYATTNF